MRHILNCKVNSGVSILCECFATLPKYVTNGFLKVLLCVLCLFVQGMKRIEGGFSFVVVLC
nr:MAG TPA: hypothetical protein [Caudoviricetes sp.]